MKPEMTIARLGVSVALRREDDGAFLLVRRGRPPALNMWAFPGGKVDYGETLKAAAVREVREETSLTVDESALTFVQPVEIIDRQGAELSSHYVLMCFTAIVGACTPIAGDDAVEARFVTLADMAALNVTDSTLAIATRLSRT